MKFQPGRYFSQDTQDDIYEESEEIEEEMTISVNSRQDFFSETRENSNILQHVEDVKEEFERLFSITSSLHPPNLQQITLDSEDPSSQTENSTEFKSQTKKKRSRNSNPDKSRPEKDTPPGVLNQCIQALKDYIATPRSINHYCLNRLLQFFKGGKFKQIQVKQKIILLSCVLSRHEDREKIFGMIQKKLEQSKKTKEKKGAKDLTVLEIKRQCNQIIDQIMAVMSEIIVKGANKDLKGMKDVIYDAADQLYIFQKEKEGQEEKNGGLKQIQRDKIHQRDLTHQFFNEIMEIDYINPELPTNNQGLAFAGQNIRNFNYQIETLQTQHHFRMLQQDQEQKNFFY